MLFALPGNKFIYAKNIPEAEVKFDTFILENTNTDRTDKDQVMADVLCICYITLDAIKEKGHANSIKIKEERNNRKIKISTTSAKEAVRNAIAYISSQMSDIQPAGEYCLKVSTKLYKSISDKLEELMEE